MKRSTLGATLIECLVYVACLTAFGNILASIYIDTTRLSVHGENTIERLRQLGEFRELFSKTVRESSGVVQSVGPYQTGGEQVVLALAPAEDTGARRYAVFALLPNKAGIQCLYLREEDGKPVVEFCRLYYMAVDGLRITCSTGAGTGRTHISLETGIYGASGKKRPPQLYRFDGVSRVEGKAS